MLSTGRSGSSLYRSRDRRYLLKTLPLEEALFLVKELKDYVNYLRDNPDTLLTRFFGMFKLCTKMRKDIYFVVMKNVFDTGLTISEHYDLKGSTIGRSVGLPEGNPEIARKDLDFRRKIALGDTLKPRFLSQIEKDAMVF